MSIDDRLQGFIESESSTAIVLRGGWGEGKTYFWKKFALDHLAVKNARRQNYAYVSLFGLNSLAELRNMLSTTIRPVDRITDDEFLALFRGESAAGSKIRRGALWFQRKVKALANAASGAGVSVPHVGNLGPLYLAFAYTFVKNAVICIDDIERRGKGLELKDALGLIADLANERNCAVVAILNDECFEDNDKVTWMAYREKVFMGEVLFQSDPMRSASFVYDLHQLNAFERIAVDAIVELGIKNVRIIQRIKAVNDESYELVEVPSEPQVWLRSMHALRRVVDLNWRRTFLWVVAMSLGGTEEFGALLSPAGDYQPWRRWWSDYLIPAVGETYRGRFESAMDRLSNRLDGKGRHGLGGPSLAEKFRHRPGLHLLIKSIG